MVARLRDTKLKMVALFKKKKNKKTNSGAVRVLFNSLLTTMGREKRKDVMSIDGIIKICMLLDND